MVGLFVLILLKLSYNLFFLIYPKPMIENCNKELPTNELQDGNDFLSFVPVVDTIQLLQ